MPGSPPRGSTGQLPSGLIDFRDVRNSPSALPPRCARIHPVSSPSVTLSDPYDGLAAERSQPKVERACAKSRGYARCLSDELHPPRRRLCKDGATSATRDRFPDRADITPLERRGCRGRYREASCRPGLVVSRRTMDGRWWKASVLRRPRRCIQSSWRVTQRANFIIDRFVPKPTHTGSRVDSRQPSASRIQPHGSRSTTSLTPLLYGS